MQVKIYTDGAARGNPDGPGGYGAVLHFTDSKGQLHEKELSAGYKKTTNNRMELMAVIAGLEALRYDQCEVTIYSDSQYVVNSVEKGWVFGWERKGFKDKKNADSIIQKDCKGFDFYQPTLQHLIFGPLFKIKTIKQQTLPDIILCYIR